MSADEFEVESSKTTKKVALELAIEDAQRLARYLAPSLLSVAFDYLVDGEGYAARVTVRPKEGEKIDSKLKMLVRWHEDQATAMFHYHASRSRMRFMNSRQPLQLP